MSRYAFQPLADELTRLFDDFESHRHNHPYSDWQAPTFGENIFVAQCYRYISRYAEPLSPGFARLLRVLTRDTHRYRYRETTARNGLLSTTEVMNPMWSRFTRIAHMILELEEFNTRVRAHSTKALVVLNLCTECGAVVVGDRSNPSYLCGPPCRMASSRNKLLPIHGQDQSLKFDGKKISGRDMHIAVSKLLAEAHAAQVMRDLHKWELVEWFIYTGSERRPKLSDEHAIFDFLDSYVTFDWGISEELNDWWAGFGVPGTDDTAEPKNVDPVMGTFDLAGNLDEPFEVDRPYNTGDLDLGGLKFQTFELAHKSDVTAIGGSESLTEKQQEQLEEHIETLIDLYERGPKNFNSKAATKARESIRKLDPTNQWGSVSWQNFQAPRQRRISKGAMIMPHPEGEAEEVLMKSLVSCQPSTLEDGTQGITLGEEFYSVDDIRCTLGLWKDEADTVDQIAQGPQVNYVFKDPAGNDFSMANLDAWVTMETEDGADLDDALVTVLSALTITAVFRSGDKTTSQAVSATDPLALLTAKQQLLDFRASVEQVDDWKRAMWEHMRGSFDSFKIDVPRFVKYQPLKVSKAGKKSKKSTKESKK